jgi:hypothetical protein
MLPDTPPPPLLSPSLLKEFYSSCGGRGKSLFRRLHSVLWEHLWGKSRLDALSIVYGLSVVLPALSVVSLAEFFLMCRLWTLSDGGKLVIDSRSLGLSDSGRHQLVALHKAGIIDKTFFHPLHPDLIRYRSSHKVFILWTAEGRRLFRQIVRRVGDHARSDDYHQSQYAIKKGWS